MLSRLIEDTKPATNLSSSADCYATALTQLVTESMDNKETIRNLTIRLQTQSVNSKEVIRNLTISNERLRALSVDNRVAIRNLTAETVGLKAQCMNKSETIRNLTAVVKRLTKRYHVCGSNGWKRVAYLDMTDPSEQCPSGFRLYRNWCSSMWDQPQHMVGACLVCSFQVIQGTLRCVAE